MALSVVAVLYILAAAFNLYIPDTGVDHKALKKNPIYLIHEWNERFALSETLSYDVHRAAAPFVPDASTLVGSTASTSSEPAGYGCSGARR